MKCQREDRQVIAVVVAVDCGGVDHLGACSRMCSQLFSSVLLLPLHLLLLPWSSMRSSMHDGFISALRAYTPSALQTLARAADPGMQVEILPAPTRLFPPSLAVVFSRSSSAPTESSECSADRQPGE